MSEGPLIRLVDVSKRFGDLVVLDGVSLDIPAGETTAIIDDHVFRLRAGHIEEVGHLIGDAPIGSPGKDVLATQEPRCEDGPRLDLFGYLVDEVLVTGELDRRLRDAGLKWMSTPARGMSRRDSTLSG